LSEQLGIQAQELPGFASVKGARVIEKTGSSFLIEFSIPQESPYFDGHFPGFSLLPAVAQVELVIRFASEFFGTGIDISEMRRIKFSKFILPDAPLHLRLQKDEKSLMFKLVSPVDESVYSSGALSISSINNSNNKDFSKDFSVKGEGK
jgi:3-hydroxymyristoyl/3-hydroxydecanoyl-(acyl carrier protein) dehydratase